ncbi:hypothetical protein [Ruegeria faecimaris]|uniref:hypothetical protein n=1 Tax=Ruegeria faecimaris TaxID=686389 RepID=UPI0024901816|nr:hypothetical protein [Ruegeria faecimaris]
MIAFDDLDFPQARTVASRESLRALGMFSAPVGPGVYDGAKLDAWLLVLLRSLVNCVAGDEDSAFFALDHLRRHVKATKDTLVTEPVNDMTSIAPVAEEVLLGICAPSFSASSDQYDAVAALADGISSILPGWDTLLYSNNELIQFVPTSDLDFNIPLWANNEASAEDPAQWVLSSPPKMLPLLSYWSNNDSEWVFWQIWYQGFVDGTPVNLDLQRRIAQIQDTIWDAGPTAVASEIERIRARWEVEKNLSELNDSLSVQASARHGIGGNNPPESIEDKRLSGAITLIWEAEEELSNALDQESPAREWIEAILAKFKAGLASLLKWCAGKVNLAVGTAIVVGTTKGATVVVEAYIAKHPEKIEALIEALERWLPFLS